MGIRSFSKIKKKIQKKMLRVVVLVCVLILCLTPSSHSKKISQKKLRRSEDELVVSRQEGPLSICGAGREFRNGRCRVCEDGEFSPGWSSHAKWRESLNGFCRPCEMPEIFVPNEKRTKCVPSPNIQSKPPVLFLPGFLASRLRARRTHEENSLEDECPDLEQGEWIQVWPPHWSTLSDICFARLLTIRTNEEGQAMDPLGWELDVDPEDPLIDRGFVYGDLEELFHRLEWKIDFVSFDWRFAPGTHGGWHEKLVNRLKTKIETEYADTKVCLAGHSYGGVAAYEFLTEMTDEWKDEHISHYVPIGAPFGGAIGTVIATAAGYALDVPIPKFIRRKILWPVQSAAPSGAYLMPVPGQWPANLPVAKTVSTEYFASDSSYLKMYDDLGLSDTKRLFQNMRVAAKVWSDEFPKPLRKGSIHVIWSTYGDEETTPEAVVFGKDFDMHGTDPGNPVETKTCLGDGTVPKYSLERFRHWIVDAEMSDSNVESTHFDNVEHKEIVSNDDFLTKFVMVLSGLEKENAG